MENLEEKAILAKEHERDRLFSIKGDDVLRLSKSEQYDKMRYEREIEANEYVKLLRMGWSYKDAAYQTRKNADRIIANWDENCSIWNLYTTKDLVCTTK